MATFSSEFALRARYVFPVSHPPIEDGYVVVGGGRIVAVQQAAPDCRVTDLGHVAITPGFVNAHTHLEFSNLATPLGTPGMRMPEWIRCVLAHRGAAAGGPDASGAAAIERGLRESLRCGVTTLGEIATSDWRGLGLAPPAPRVTMFFEMLAPVAARVPAVMAAAEQFLSLAQTERVLPGLSPHAPYTVRNDLLDAAVELAKCHQVPLAMHLAESPEELELLHAGTGGMASLLRDLNSWDASPDSRHGGVLDYLQRLSAAPRALAIHGNYLDQAEIDFLARHSTTMSVVYCPRTHHFFGHAPYPLAAMLSAGVTMALGTDSRASNPDLNLLAEMKVVASAHSGVPLSTVLELGTLGSAKALRRDDEVGTLAIGKQADLAAVQIPAEKSGDPHELLFDARSRVVQTWISGRCAWE